MSASQQLELHASVPVSFEVMGDDTRPSNIWPDKQFLQKILQSWLKDPNIRITEFTSRIATNKGDNYTSDMFRATAKCEQRRDPVNIIIKRMINTGAGGEAITKSTAFVREEMMLRTVLPEMYSVLKRVLPDVEPFGAEYVYSVPGVLAMEDLQLTGFRMAQRRFGLDLNHCSLVLHTLARYHAASLYLMEQKPTNFSLFEKSLLVEDCMKTAVENSLTGMLTTLSEEMKHMDGLEKYSTKLSRLIENISANVQRSTEDHEEDDFLVLSHGDLWVNNVLFRYSSSGDPEGVRFVDLQLPSITSPCIDLHYFLTASSNEKVRTTYMDQLLEEYHKTLCETMAALKCSTRPPTFEKLKQDFDKRTYYGMFSAFSVMPVVLSEPGEFELNDALDTGKVSKQLFRSKAYRKALEHFLPLYERKGFL